MNQYRFLIVFLFILAGLWACQKKEYVQPITGQPLVGTWQYIERGYSPGAGYFIDKIPLNPAQLINFTPQGTVSTVNMSDGTFTDARTYRVDSTGSGTKLVLLDEKQQPLNYPMAIRLGNDTLRLLPPCIEGCHFLFVRLR